MLRRHHGDFPCNTLIIGLRPEVSKLRPYQNGVASGALPELPELSEHSKKSELSELSEKSEQSAVEKVIHIGYTKLIGMTKARLPSAYILDRVL